MRLYSFQYYWLFQTFNEIFPKFFNVQIFIYYSYKNEGRAMIDNKNKLWTFRNFEVWPCNKVASVNVGIRNS